MTFPDSGLDIIKIQITVLDMQNNGNPDITFPVGKTLGNGIRTVVQFQRNLFDSAGDFRVYPSSVVKSAVYRSGGYACKFGNFLDRNRHGGSPFYGGGWLAP